MNEFFMILRMHFIRCKIQFLSNLNTPHNKCIMNFTEKLDHRRHRSATFCSPKRASKCWVDCLSVRFVAVFKTSLWQHPQFHSLHIIHVLASSVRQVQISQPIYIKLINSWSIWVPLLITLSACLLCVCVCSSSFFFSSSCSMVSWTSLLIKEIRFPNSFPSPSSDFSA